MPFRSFLALLALGFLGVGVGRLSAEETAPTFPAYGHPVTTWVPPYAVGKSRAQLTAAFGDVAAKDGLSHLALQFWVPGPDGVVKQVGFREVNDAAILDLRDWAHRQGIRALLCVYNGEKKWDWPLAKNAFADQREDFTRSLIAEVERLGLDGIDIDLEGPGDFEADKPAFLDFMKGLSTQLRARKKALTVDSFSYKWNAPNQGWWPDLLPLVDALTSMGYEGNGLGAPTWRSYAEQKKAAGEQAAKLQMGMPSNRDAWQGNSALEQLQWVVKDAGVGVAIWDAQLPSPAWRTPEVWQQLREIRGAAP
jgi:hypothetical protein